MKDLKIVASMIGKQKNIPIQVGNFDTASTDGLSIRLPDSIKSSEGHALAHGYIDHEAGHVQLTDMNSFRVAAMSGRPYLKDILNILEDVRIEYAVGKQYPGSVQNLKRVIKILKGNGELEVPRVSPDSISYIGTWLLFWARSHFLSQDLSDFAEEMEREIAPDIVSKIKGAVSNIIFEPDTGAVLVMAQKVLDLISGDQGQPDDSDTGDQDQSSDDSDTSDLGSLIAKALKAHVEIPTMETPYLPSNTEYPDMASGYGKEYLKDPLPWRKTMSSLQHLLDGEILKAREVSRKGKRVLTSKASRLAIGDTKIFKKSSLNRGKNSSFILLLDTSTSMNANFGKSNRMNVAIEAVATLYKALEKQKNSKVRAAMFPDNKPEMFSVLEFKPQPNMRVDDYHRSTPLHTALEWARVELACEPKEVSQTIIVVTDGQPDYYYTAKSVAEKIKAQGINLLGIGLELNRLDFFSAWEEINKAEDLPMALTRMAKRGLA